MLSGRFMDGEWIEVGELLRITGMSERKRAFIRWRDAGLIPKPQTRPRPGGGTISEYPPGTLAQVRRLQELENDKSVPRSLDAWRLVLWDESYTVDVRPSVLRLFDKLLGAMSDKEKTAAALG